MCRMVWCNTWCTCPCAHRVAACHRVAFVLQPEGLLSRRARLPLHARPLKPRRLLHLLGLRPLAFALRNCFLRDSSGLGLASHDATWQEEGMRRDADGCGRGPEGCGRVRGAYESGGTEREGATRPALGEQFELIRTTTDAAKTTLLDFCMVESATPRHAMPPLTLLRAGQMPCSADVSDVVAVVIYRSVCTRRSTAKPSQVAVRRRAAGLCSEPYGPTARAAKPLYQAS